MAKDFQEPPHKAGEGSDYMMGHSTSEAERLDQQHKFFRHVVDGRLISPVLDHAVRSGHIRRVLDIGTGTGIWCYEAAAELREMGIPAPMEFVGVDIAESEQWKHRRMYPPGVQRAQDAYATISLQVADLNDDDAMHKVVEQHGKFDLINSRMLISAVKSGKWLEYLKRIFSLLRPGGYVQLFEADMINSHAGRANDPTVAEALIITHAIYNGSGLDAEAAVRLADWLYEAGFVRVRDIANWCNPVVRQADGNLKIDDMLYGWHSTAYGVLKPLFLKLRDSPNYSQFLEKLPPQAFQSIGDRKPEALLANEVEYDDYLKRHEIALTQDPRYRTVFRSVVAQRPQ